MVVSSMLTPKPAHLNMGDKHMTFAKKLGLAFIIAAMAPASVASDITISGSDQDVSGGTVVASEITAAKNGWLVVHRTDDAGKPGLVVGHAPIRAGDNSEIVAILTEPVNPGEKLMLMVHGEDGGMKTGIFEYTLGAKEDGPVRVDDKLVMTIISAK